MKKLSLKLLSETVSANRKARKITQLQLSKLTGINRSLLSRLETGDYTPSADQLFTLSEVLGFDPAALFVSSDDQRPADSLGYVFAEHVFVVDDFHAAAAENETRADHHRVATDLLDASECFVDVRGHAAFRHRDAEVIHHLAEQVAVFSDIDGVDARTENLDAFVGEGAGDVQRGLTTELHDDASRLLTPSASAATPRS